MKLGFAVKVLGKSGLKSHDTRRWQNDPHLSVSLAYLRDIFSYLKQIDVHMYRMSSDLAPYITHPDLPQFHKQIDECANELRAMGAMARQDGLRLSFHPGAHVVLNSPDPQTVRKAIADLNALTRILDTMELGPEATIVIHVGGVYDDQTAAMNRFEDRFLHLPEAVQRRLVLENDDHAYSIGETYALYQRTGIRLILDHLHYCCNPTPGTTLRQALIHAQSTWPDNQTPKIHFSSSRTAMITTERRDPAGRKRRGLGQPRLTQHADLIDPFAFIALLELARGGRDMDVMLECKAQDLALLRLRRHLNRFAPDLVHELRIS